MPRAARPVSVDLKRLDKLLAPASVAVIGASRRIGSLGFDTVEMLLRGGFAGDVYPVNPSYETILGLPCYPDLNSIEKPVDLAVLCIAAKRLEDYVERAINARAGALVITANAVVEKDTSPTLAARLAQRCADAGIPVCGHNAMGFYNNDRNLRVCGFSAPDEGVRGNIAFITQSGSVFSTLAHNDPQLKFNLAITTGCETVTTVADYMLYALDQPTTRVIGLYLETVRKPELFTAALKQAALQGVPIVAMKVGRSKLGAKFALSHSGGLAGDDDALQAVFDRYGVIRTKSLDEMVNTMLLHNYCATVPPGGLVVIADSGGERNLVADEAEHVGIAFAQLSPSTMDALAAVQEVGQEAANPLDPWGTGLEFERIFGESMAIMMADDNAALGVMSQDLRDGYFLTNGCLEAIDIARAQTDKPLAFMTNFSGTRRSATTKALNDRAIPVMSGTRDALHAVRNFLNYRDYTYLPGKASLPETIKDIDLAQVSGVLQEYDALRLLAGAGIPTVTTYAIRSANELDLIAAQLTYPVVLKTAERGVLHKSDVGGVVLAIDNYGVLLKAYRRISDRLGPLALIQPMMRGGCELILGMKTDDAFGALVIVGAGGTLAEYLKDSFTIMPDAPEQEVVNKIERLRVYPILQGVRGTQPIKLDLLIDTILRFTSLTQVLAGVVQEIDINPLHVSAQGVIALDALVIAKDS